MAIADGGGVPVAVGVASASPDESTLVEPTLDRRKRHKTQDGRPLRRY
jgi:hypothetical protein